MLVVDDLLFLPVKGLIGLFRKIADTVDEELTDEGRVKDDLLKYNMLYETDQITLPEYEKQEKRLMRRLEEIRKFKQKLSGAAPKL
jgi:hypothetical protein